jgi:hypothetical protein
MLMEGAVRAAPTRDAEAALAVFSSAFQEGGTGA